MRSLCACLLILVLQPPFALAAQASSTQNEDLWRVRSQAIKEAVASLNRAEQTNQHKDRKLLDHLGLARTLPLSLLEMDEVAVKEGIASIASVETRAQLRLELLGETLRRMEVHLKSF